MSLSIPQIPIVRRFPGVWCADNQLSPTFTDTDREIPTLLQLLGGWRPARPLPLPARRSRLLLWRRLAGLLVVGTSPAAGIAGLVDRRMHPLAQLCPLRRDLDRSQRARAHLRPLVQERPLGRKSSPPVLPPAWRSVDVRLRVSRRLQRLPRDRGFLCVPGLFLPSLRTLRFLHPPGADDHHSRPERSHSRRPEPRLPSLRPQQRRNLRLRRARPCGGHRCPKCDPHDAANTTEYELHNLYGNQLRNATYHALLSNFPNKRPFTSRARRSRDGDLVGALGWR